MIRPVLCRPAPPHELLVVVGPAISNFRILSQLSGGVMCALRDAEDSKPHRYVVLNWFEELKQEVPAGKKSILSTF